MHIDINIFPWIFTTINSRFRPIFTRTDTLATYAIEQNRLYSKCLEVNSAPRFLLVDALSVGKSCCR